MGLRWQYSLGGAALFLALAWSASAETYQALALQSARLYGENLEAPSEVRDHYLSQGQEYMRNYMRDQILQLMATEWLALDMDSMQAGVALNLQQFYSHEQFPLDANLRVFADEDLNQYLQCGRFLPIEVEVDSAYTVNSQLKLHTKLEAPFDDVLRLQFGPQIAWSTNLSSSLEYRLSNSSQGYDGLSLGLGWSASDWRCKFSYEITSDFVQLQQIGLAKTF